MQSKSRRHVLSRAFLTCIAVCIGARALADCASQSPAIHFDESAYSSAGKAVSGDVLKISLRPSKGNSLKSASISVNGDTAPIVVNANAFPAPSASGWTELEYHYSVGRPAVDSNTLVLPAKRQNFVKVVATDSAGSCVDQSQPFWTLDPGVFAVVVGINEYPRAGSRASLAFARNDADAIAMHLQANFGHPAPDHIFLLTDQWKASDGTDPLSEYRRGQADRGTILRALSTIVQNVDTNGTLIFYYAGHGFAAQPGSGFTHPYYLLAQNSALDDGVDMLEFDEVVKYMANARAQQNIIILDACFSEAVVTGGATSDGSATSRAFGNAAVHDEGIAQLLADGRKVYTMTASSGKGLSYEFKDISHGIFTYYLLKSTREAQIRNDITVEQAFSFVSDAIQNETRPLGNPRQTPNHYIFGLGDRMTWRLHGDVR